MKFHPTLLLPVILAAPASAQTIAPQSAFQITPLPLAIHRRAITGQPFTVAGPRGVLVGQQEGTFEAWILPIKLLSHFTLRAEVDGYSVPIELNPAAAQIDVFPDHTTITYSHIALTVRQTMFAPADSPAGTGAIALFEIDSIRPVNLTFSFTPEMRPMWPQRGGINPSPEWNAEAGAYILHTDFPDLAGAVTIPSAQPGILAPYQEKPQTHPLELRLHYDPAKDHGKLYPLLMAVGQTPETASTPALLARLSALNAALPQLSAHNTARYQHFLHTLTSVSTPDPYFNDAFQWAAISIEQLQAQLQPRQNIPAETGLVAGYFSSGDSARPGFGWFFGRDTLYTTYAINSLGDFALTRTALDFLIARQRPDGKMPHEYSQTAPDLDWAAFPYLYAAADSTPLFLLAMQDYVLASGDLNYLKTKRESIFRAWQFETTHTSADGIYNNSQGTGWVESWPGGQPHQEIYLALLDQQASAAMAQLATLLDDPALAAAAKARATNLATTIESEYYQPATNDYAFSRNPDGSLDRTPTIYPSLAWWTSADSILKHTAPSLRAWASHTFSTDWGARDVAETSPVYDPISYHQGSVWPLFTGWASLADYRSNHPLSGYEHLRQNFQQTTTQDLGAVTELLSGAFFQPFGRSTSHQLWSSAMVITPALRGLFGLTLNAASHTITVDPHLPATWPSATVNNLRVAGSVCNLNFTRQSGTLRITSTTLSGPAVLLARPSGGAPAPNLDVPLPALEVAVKQDLPEPGARTAQLKVLDEVRTPRSLTLTLEAPAASTQELTLIRNLPVNPSAENAHITAHADGNSSLQIAFPAGSGYATTVVKLTW